MLRDIDVKQLKEEMERDTSDSGMGILRFVLRGGGWEAAPMLKVQAQALIRCWCSCEWMKDPTPLWISGDATCCVDMREVVSMSFISEDDDEAESWR